VSGVLAAGAAAALVLPAGTGLAASDPHQTNVFIRTDLASDNPRLTPTVDPNIINPWGVSEFPHGPLWVSNEGHANTTLYSGADSTSAKLNPVGLVVSVPGGRPTGQAFNTTVTTANPGFSVTDGKTKAPAVFLFATLNGTIAGWAPTVGGTAMNPSTMAEQATKVPRAVFTGLAQSGNRLYAADVFHHSVDVFGADFTLLNMPGAFEDPLIPRRFSPFNIAAINGPIVVTYAAPHAFPGGGFVDVFTPDGVLVKRLIRGGLLDQPWGLALSPSAGFGPFNNALLVGNHGNGLINAFSPSTGRFLGTIRLAGGRPFVAPNLWGLIFGDGPAAPGGPPSAGTPSTLFFTEGAWFGRPGLIGKITAAP
jgi:uncharacterized protein (TIGR03118 family)